MSYWGQLMLERFLALTAQHVRLDRERELDRAAYSRMSDDGGTCFLDRGFLPVVWRWPAVRWYVDRIERTGL